MKTRGHRSYKTVIHIHQAWAGNKTKTWQQQAFGKGPRSLHHCLGMTAPGQKALRIHTCSGLFFFFPSPNLLVISHSTVLLERRNFSSGNRVAQPCPCTPALQHAPQNWDAPPGAHASRSPDLPTNTQGSAAGSAAAQHSHSLPRPLRLPRGCMHRKHTPHTAPAVRARPQ